MNQKTFLIGIILFVVYIVIWYFVLKASIKKNLVIKEKEIKESESKEDEIKEDDTSTPINPIPPVNPIIPNPLEPIPPPVNPIIPNPLEPIPAVEPVPIIPPVLPVNPDIIINPIDPTKPLVNPIDIVDIGKPTPPTSRRWQDCGGGITHTVEKISGFCGTYQWLSNFEPCKVTYLGKEFLSVESAYHAAKYADDVAMFEQFVPLNAVNAYKLSKTLPAYDYKSFDAKKLDLIRDFVAQKFSIDPLKSKLKATGDAKLEDYNWWGNKFWGMSPDGENWLGVILMETRSKL